MSQIVENASEPLTIVDNDEFPWFNVRWNARVNKVTRGNVFYTADNAIGRDPVKLSRVFLDYLPSDTARAHYNCRTCLDVIDTIGWAVTVDSETGKLQSVFWDDEGLNESTPETSFWASAITAMREVVESCKIVDVIDGVLANRYVKSANKYVFGANVRGLRKDGSNHWWEHISAIFPVGKVRVDSLEQYGMLTLNIYRYKADVLDKALLQMRNDAAMSTRVSHVERLSDFIAMRSRVLVVTNRRHRESMIWDIAIKYNMNLNNFSNVCTGQYVTAVGDGRDAAGKANFISQTKPENYMRATAAPSEGNVAVTKRLVSDLGIEKALVNRRMANVDDILEWIVKILEHTETDSTSIFDGLAKAKPSTMSKELPVFSKTILVTRLVGFLNDSTNGNIVSVSVAAGLQITVKTTKAVFNLSIGSVR